jgi:ABC-2 type transport system permease protein
VPRLLRDTWILFAYAARSTVGNPTWIVLGLIQPALWLVLFGPLLEPVAGPGVPAGEALELFVPGVLMILALFSSLFIGFELIADLRAGVLERLAATPVSRLAMLLGRVLRDVVALVLQAVVLLAIAALLGFRAHPASVAAALVLVGLVGVVGASLSYGFALTVRDENALSAVLTSLSLPLMLLAGALLPMSLAPTWLQFLARLNPFYYAVEGARALLAESSGSVSILLGFGVMTVVAVLAAAWVVPMFRRVAA